jgi:DnaJ-class molecular chaperone
MPFGKKKPGKHRSPVPLVKCKPCNGSGWIVKVIKGATYDQRCPACKGKGKVPKDAPGA